MKHWPCVWWCNPPWFFRVHGIVPCQCLDERWWNWKAGSGVYVFLRSWLRDIFPSFLSAGLDDHWGPFQLNYSILFCSILSYSVFIFAQNACLLRNHFDWDVLECRRSQSIDLIRKWLELNLRISKFSAAPSKSKHFKACSCRSVNRYSQTDLEVVWNSKSKIVNKDVSSVL